MTEPTVERGPIVRAAVGIGLYAGAFAMAYGAVAVSSGLNVAQAMVLSLVLFTGASQFAFAGVVAAGGNPFAAIAAALLLGVRNAFYGVSMSPILTPRGLGRLGTAHFVIDETTAMAIGQPTRPAQRYAFWVTGVVLFVCWQLGSLAGAVARPGDRSRRLRPRGRCAGRLPGPALARPAADLRPAGRAGRRRRGTGPGAVRATWRAGPGRRGGGPGGRTAAGADGARHDRALGGGGGGRGRRLPAQARRRLAAGVGAEPPDRAAGRRLPAHRHAVGTGGRASCSTAAAGTRWTGALWPGWRPAWSRCC